MPSKIGYPTQNRRNSSDSPYLLQPIRDGPICDIITEPSCCGSCTSTNYAPDKRTSGSRETADKRSVLSPQPGSSSDTHRRTSIPAPALIVVSATATSELFLQTDPVDSFPLRESYSPQPLATPPSTDMPVPTFAPTGFPNTVDRASLFISSIFPAACALALG